MGNPAMELLEREPHLEALGQALAQSRASGRIALVLGEAGIGKTSLVDRFAAGVWKPVELRLGKGGK